ncbi:hypothetical protein GGH96_004918 [Coemansia sp. RSA 1972]|nr:hypothetical protein GGH96_004918 [Coemansia sp. RSA 1972]
MKLFAAISSILAISAVSAKNYTLPVFNDVGLIYTDKLCGTTPCKETNLYVQPSYTAHEGNNDDSRILMSFSLVDKKINPSSVSSCMLEFPMSTEGSVLRISSVTSAYDAMTVTPDTAPTTGSVIAEKFGTTKIEITEACKTTENGVVSVMVNAYGMPFHISAGATRLAVST